MSFFKTPYSKRGFFGTPYNGLVGVPGGLLLIKAISDIVRLTEGVSHLKGMTRVVFDLEDITEEVSRLKAMARSISEAVEIDEILNRLRALIALILDLVTIEDGSQTPKGMSRSVLERMKILEVSFDELVHLTHPRPARPDVVGPPRIALRTKARPGPTVTPVPEKNPTVGSPKKIDPEGDCEA